MPAVQGQLACNGCEQNVSMGQEHKTEVPTTVLVPWATAAHALKDMQSPSQLNTRLLVSLMPSLAKANLIRRRFPRLCPQFK